MKKIITIIIAMLTTLLGYMGYTKVTAPIEKAAIVKCVCKDCTCKNCKCDGCCCKCEGCKSKK